MPPSKSKLITKLESPWSTWRQALQLSWDAFATQAPLPTVSSFDSLYTISERLAAGYRPDSENVLGNTINMPGVVFARLKAKKPVGDCDDVAAALAATIAHNKLVPTIELELCVAYWWNAATQKTDGHCYCGWARDGYFYNIGNWSKGHVRGPYADRASAAEAFAGKAPLLGHGTYNWRVDDLSLKQYWLV